MAEMTDKKRQLNEFRAIQVYKASPDKDLEQAVRDYLLWMEAEGYSHASQENYKYTLDQFLRFVESEKYQWDEIFTLETLKSFQELYSLTHTSVR